VGNGPERLGLGHIRPPQAFHETPRFGLPMRDTDSDIASADDAPAGEITAGPPITARQTAEKFGLTTRTLSLYSRRGLVAPTRQGRCRVYGPLDQLRLALIIKARKLGFTLAEITQIVAAERGRASPALLPALRQKCLDRIHRGEVELWKINESLIELRRIHTLLQNKRPSPPPCVPPMPSDATTE
jgi:DNA-binding transcriptional MerR regulator